MSRQIAASLKGPLENETGAREELLVAVVADGLDRAAFQRLHAGSDLLLGRRLLAHVRVATLFGTGEESRGRLTAEIAIDALLVDVKLALPRWFPTYLLCWP